jgi:hypothetical protein
MVYDLPDGFLHSRAIGSMTPSTIFIGAAACRH